METRLSNVSSTVALLPYLSPLPSRHDLQAGIASDPPSAAARIAAHAAATSARSVGSAPIDTRTIQRPSIVAGVR